MLLVVLGNLLVPLLFSRRDELVTVIVSAFVTTWMTSFKVRQGRPFHIHKYVNEGNFALLRGGRERGVLGWHAVTVSGSLKKPGQLHACRSWAGPRSVALLSCH